MKYKDPLATLHLMGGSLPIHLAMVLNGGFTYYTVTRKVNCPQLGSISDVTWMIWAHFFSIILFLVSKNISRSEGNGIYIKSILKTIRMMLYMFAFIKL